MSYRENYENWLNSPALSQEEKAELEAIRMDEKEIESRFFDQLAFGTAGLRGTMGVGLYRMNVHVIRHATQAFAQVILEEGPEAAARGVAVCFDCRNNSGLFAREAACVMAGNGIPVRLFQALRPTPELSFAVREYGCIAGINVTASHNPKEYNGYKVYWEDGAQLPPRHADEVARKMRELDVFASVKTMDYDQAVSQGKITLLGAETDERFLSNVMEQVKTVVGAHRDMAQRRGIDIEIDGDESLDINGEGEQIQAAVAKLLENAIAYSPDGKCITVSVKPNEDGTKVLLSVLDRGCGIAQKEQSRIFERFYRGGNQNGHSEEGIGLGLAIVKHVALTHHGSASVWSAPGQGSTFTLELPVARN